MPKLKIYGKADPVVGVKEYYSINELFGNSSLTQFAQPQFQITPNEQIKWNVWILEKGSWRIAKGNVKTGATIDITFHQSSLTRKAIRLVVEANGEKAVLDITTKRASKAKISLVELLDSDLKKPSRPFAYGDWIVARVYCVEMEKFPLTVTLWEDDGGKTKQNTTNVKIQEKKTDVLNGKADVAFFLDPSNAWLANAKLAPDDKDEGEFHEYYVTAEIFEKVPKRVASLNTNVPNPDYNPDVKPTAQKQPVPEVKKQTPAEQKGPSKKEEKKIAKLENKVHDYHETKVVVNTKPVLNPVIERYNSLMTVNVGGVWGSKKTGNCVCKENNFYWSNKLTCDERKKVLEVCAKIWGEDKKKDKASELMAIMHLETIKTFSPSKKGVSKNGTKFIGLIQFSATTAKSIGTTYEALGEMTFIEQMKYVEKYLKQNKDKMTTIVDFYLQVIKPGDVGKGNQPDHAVFDESVSVPDGDGRNTSQLQRDKNINREPWVTKYGYASNPTFMTEKDEKKLRRRWVYTRQVYEERYGTIGGKTTIKEIDDVLRNEHYKPGATEIFKGKCDDVGEEKKEVADGVRAPWYQYAIQELKDFGGIRQTESPLKERIYDYFDLSSYPAGTNETFWCSAFVNWCFEQVNEYKKTNPIKNEAALDWLIPSLATEKRSNLDGWKNGELITNIEDAFPGVVIVFSYSHVAFLAGISKDGENLIYLGGNQSDGKKGDGKGKRTICTNPISKKGLGTKFWLIKPKNYTPSTEEKKLPKLSSDGGELNYEKSR